NSLISQDASGSYEDLEEIQDEDTHHSENTSEYHNEVEHEKSMNVEMQSIKENEVWSLVELPPNAKTIGSKCLFKKKIIMDGNVHTYKARLVAKGYTQTYGINYEETFALISDIKAIRIIIAITTFYDYEIWRMDVKTAFLNGHLTKEVYMMQPEGFVNPKYPRRVCKLQLSIYGLSRSWNKRKDLGEAAYILGIKIYRDRSKRVVGLCQSAYIMKILNRFHMENSKHGNTPMQEKLILSKTRCPSTPEEVSRMQRVPYASAIGSIIYASTKLSTTAMSSEAAVEAVWIRKLIDGLGLVPTNKVPTDMYCDDSGALIIANEPRVQRDVKHY
ncbi:retrotransposon protein, putative, ty1-copia subclass, partial [Tanacetum coccineum]